MSWYFRRIVTKLLGYLVEPWNPQELGIPFPHAAFAPWGFTTGRQRGDGIPEPEICRRERWDPSWDLQKGLPGN